jgi:amidase
LTVTWNALKARALMRTWDAVETMERIRRGEVRVQDVLEAAIARAEEASGLGAVVVTSYDRARASLARLPHGSLFGVPTFVKDLAQVRGVETAWGSAAAGRFVSRRSDPFVKRFELTGVLVLGKSATPELGLTATTEPIGRPPTRNPWDPSRSAGGSSGGAAALVAAGVVPLAHASDGGGSIRIPASCCGLVGFKPTRSRIDMEGSGLLPVNIATHGVLTRTVRDTLAFHRALTRLEDLAPAPKRPLRIGVFADAPSGTAVDPEVRAAVAGAARACATIGHHVEEIACPFDGQVNDDFIALWGYLAWAQVRTARWFFHRGFDPTKFEPLTDGLARWFARDWTSRLSAILRLRGFSRTYSRVMERYDVLLSPTVSQPAPRLGYLGTDVPFETAFERLRTYAQFTPIQNAAGAPAISLPLGRAASGMPIGVQFAAAQNRERTLLELAEALETACPWPVLAPRPAVVSRAQ